MKNGRLQVGIIGCGGIAQTKHLPSLSRLPALCDIAAFCDADPARLASTCAKYGAPGARTYATYPELLADEAIDVVHVLTPNAFHAEVTIAALDATLPRNVVRSSLSEEWHGHLGRELRVGSPCLAEDRR